MGSRKKRGTGTVPASSHPLRGFYGDLRLRDGTTSHGNLMILTCVDGHQVICLRDANGSYANPDMNFVPDSSVYIVYTDSDVYTGDQAPAEYDCWLQS